MKVVGSFPEIVYIKDLVIGATFYLIDECGCVSYYMKTNDIIDCDDLKLNAVSLETGDIVFVRDNDLCFVVDCVLTVK